MSERQKAGSSIFPNPLVLMIMIGVGILFTCGLTLLAFNSRGMPVETPASNASARKATLPVYPTATLFPGAPIFPDAPTGPATLLPTVDFDLAGTPPPPNETADFIEEATENAEDPVPDSTEVPISTPPTPVPPSGTYISFTDPNLKISFEYPDNWFVKPTGGIGEDITLQNSDPSKIGMTKGVVAAKPDQFNIEIGYDLGALEGYSSFEEWVDIIEQRVPAENRISRTNLENVDGHRAIQLVSTGVIDPNTEFKEILIEKNKDVYFIRVIPANTNYLEVLDHVLETMQLP